MVPLVKLNTPDGDYELRELTDFHNGPFTWDELTHTIVDRLGIMRFGYLYPIASDKADAFVDELNNFHALNLLAQDVTQKR